MSKREKLPIRFISDLHLNCNGGTYVIPPLPNDKNTVLVIPGDIWEGFKVLKYGPEHKNWLKETAANFRAVIIVFGNHDYWGEHLLRYPQEFAAKANDIGNLHILHNSSVIIDDVKFLGGTLWTDFNDQNPLTMLIAKDYMNDYKYTRAGEQYRKMQPRDVLVEYSKTYLYLANELENKTTAKTVVVTHHAPCELSVGDNFRGDPSNYFYFTDLSDFILRTQPDVWLHGHIHQRKSYMIGDTLVACNPYGYRTQHGTEKTECNETDTIYV